MINRTISHYKILDKLGQGAMGEVYKAEDVDLKRIVALKFLSRETLGAEDVKPRLIREAREQAICPGSAGTGERAFSVSVDAALAGAGFSRHGGLSIRSGGEAAREASPTLPCHRLDEPARLSLGMVRSLQSPLPFHLTVSL